MASIWRKTKTGVWYVTYREEGKQRVRSLRTKDKREAQRLKRAIEDKLDVCGAVAVQVTDRTEVESANPTLDEFWDEFSIWAVANRSSQTVAEYEIWFRQLKRFTGATYLGDIRQTDIEAFKTSLRAKGSKKKDGLQDSSINNALKTVQSIFNHAIKLGLYTGTNPVAGVERFKVPQFLDRDYLDGSQIEALLAAAREHAGDRYVKSVEAKAVFLAIALMALAGLRKREACFARWDWIDWEGRVMHVTNDEHFTTKNRRPRIVSLSGQLLDILTSHRKEEGYILETVRPSGGKTEYRVDFKKGFDVVCRKAAIRATPHDLRHSFASRHAVAGTSLHVIAGWLGHSSTWVTQRYAHYQKTFNAAADNI